MKNTLHEFSLLARSRTYPATLLLFFILMFACLPLGVDVRASEEEAGTRDEVRDEIRDEIRDEAKAESEDAVDGLFAVSTARLTFDGLEEDLTRDLNLTEDLFAGYVERVFFQPESAFRRCNSRGDGLEGIEQKVYECLVPSIEQAAKGELSKAVFTIPIGKLLSKTSYTANQLGVSSLTRAGYVSSEAKEALFSQAYVDVDLLLGALLSDFPYEMYWCDKEYNVIGGVKGGAEVSGKKLKFSSDSCYEIRFAVAAPYSRSGNPGTNFFNTEKTASTLEAAENAREVADTAKSMADYEKLNYFRDYICDAVEYDWMAANASYDEMPYGDPWQLIYVFDEDSSTNVVCEGYAKAFKYLCDLTVFNNSLIKCHIATGEIPEGGHMWNIVRMDNGKNYVVDLTNYDDDKGKFDEGFYLAGASKKGSYAYRVATPSYADGMLYQYDENMLAQFTKHEMTIAGSSYQYLESRGCGAGIPTKVKNLSLKAGSKSLVVSFDRKASSAVKYTVAYRLAGGSGKTTATWKTVSVDTPGKSLTSLLSKTKYQVKVRAFKKVNGVKVNGPWSKIVTKKTK